MVVVLTYWLSFEYVRDPRRALEPESAQAALLRGAHHVLNLLMPYLEDGQRAHLQAHLARPTRRQMAETPQRNNPYQRRHTMAKWTPFPHAGDYV
jgi:hypothetical protein